MRTATCPHCGAIWSWNPNYPLVRGCCEAGRAEDEK
jgi:hypothetical protein